MRMLTLFSVLFLGFSAGAAETHNFNFTNKDLTEVVQMITKITGKSFVVSPDLKGKGTVTNMERVTAETAYNQFASILHLNSFAIVQNGSKSLIIPARSAERSNLPVVTELPPLEPEQLVTFVYKPKNVKAEDIMKNVRILPSRDGELAAAPNNTLIITDFVSNLYRVAAILKEIDSVKK